ncbi:spermidine/putrescine ABC transporter substrate-binding protein [Streptomyces sp. NPDC012461]|jgi:spermidine/putrescine transport system substrate-binding protein|uniref:Spermidine/putrescine ABC transporter substrate-binding protein n=2 Tax=unclassified Streptomyces TaxID=2593676 RepID=A0A6G3QSL6_9ACTN|nr:MULTISPECIES: spermidine/putrescine ABC transporter substrate-binding protein [unclassified Streptomyces]MBM7088031.1 spermidine/putrescine ABC transporter substrate-binding protein [Streptomyces sp. S12]NEA86489.1 spermidine/putrescine ABC transporter substrate-binding protein [Streptomyces sp. SID14436]NEC79596.1 spermidine/putrescine ABC transporter substrate-binding protein [Streptomyces sp. SID7958]NED18677.1 spermidine/putrescine ABC transporter substrate-binding protein [Streptomyces 
MEQYEPDRLSPAQVAAMRRSFRNGRAALTRRSLLRASAGGALAIGGAGALSACGIPAAGNTEGGVSAEDHSAKEKSVSFSNWTEYMDVDDSGRNHPTLDAFTRRTGIKVKYTEDINDNTEFFGKIKPQMAAGQDTGRDIIVLTDWLAARLIRLGWVQKLDPANLPNAFTNLSAQFRNPDWDPGRAYSYPWQGISTVLAYNKKALDGIEVKTLSDLLDNPKLKGRVGLLTEMRDTVGMTLLDMGKDPGKFTADDYDGAIARLQKAVDKSQIRRFTGNDYTADLTKGDIAACLAWAGDIVQLQADNPDIEFLIPDSGYLTSSDNMLIPNKARHKTNAERLIDYYFEPKPAAELAAYINFVCPVEGVKDELAQLDEDAANNPLILPDKAMQAKSRAFRSLSSEEETAFEEKFAKLTGA